MTSRPFWDNPMRRIAKARAMKKKRIKDVWADTGKADQAIDALNKKRNTGHPSPDNLPF